MTTAVGTYLFVRLLSRGCGVCVCVCVKLLLWFTSRSNPRHDGRDHKQAALVPGTRSAGWLPCTTYLLWSKVRLVDVVKYQELRRCRGRRLKMKMKADDADRCLGWGVSKDP